MAVSSVVKVFRRDGATASVDLRDLPAKFPGCAELDVIEPLTRQQLDLVKSHGWAF
jgi:hypothetical protein